MQRSRRNHGGGGVPRGRSARTTPRSRQSTREKESDVNRDRLELLKEEIEHASMLRIVEEFPGQLEVCSCGIWRWIHDLEYKHRPEELAEASDAYYACGGKPPGPVQWYEDILTAKHGTWHRFRLITTLHFPVDLYASIEAQAAEMLRVCRMAQRKLIKISGERPPRKGQGRKTQLAKNILLVVLRDWKGTSTAAILKRLHVSDTPRCRRRIAVRLNSARRLLKAHAQGYQPGPLLYKTHMQE